ncbi:MAG: nicotinate-nucleotide--dimethylbenzimidazole phosphoribosyltransferase, partial [Candidatus Deferrimicrobiaceae bacterium]
DMGIGNTTAAGAVVSVITGRPAEDVTGRGTGIDNAALQRKIRVVREAIVRNRPDRTDGIDVLAKVGGFEIGGLSGVILGGAARRVPVVIDGFISGAAALIAVTLCPRARDYLIAGHLSPEPGHRICLEWLGLMPVLDLAMRLGEGTGAALAMGLVEGACRVLAEMATFEEGEVSRKGP